MTLGKRPQLFPQSQRAHEAATKIVVGGVEGGATRPAEPADTATHDHMQDYVTRCKFGLNLDDEDLVELIEEPPITHQPPSTPSGRKRTMSTCTMTTPTTIHHPTTLLGDCSRKLRRIPSAAPALLLASPKPKLLVSPYSQTPPSTSSIPRPASLQHLPTYFTPERFPVVKTSLKKLPSKTSLVIQPKNTCKSKCVAMERFRRSKTRKFFHPYAKEIGAIQALKEVASSPNEAAAKFASEALTVIGEEVPYKLVQQVPSWTADDVQYWVKKIGFEEYVDQFAKQKVDGDLLLHLNENDLDHDIGMHSGLHRKRFLRELESLKIAADYSAVDETNLDQFLMSLSPELSVYTYQMLSNGVNRSLLSSLTDDLMQNACGINNPIHRLKLIKAFENSKHPDDVEVAMLSKQIDVFISYRRSNGNQLASLINVLLQLRGYKVFIDVERLSAGNFDNYLLKNIQAAKHFILVLTPKAFDRLLNDENCEDWIHKELRCAFEHHKNIIPIFDQQFEYPAKETQIPEDIRLITKINGVKWVHDYQDACMAKVVRFIESDINRNTYKYGNNVQKKPAPISKTAWSNNATTRTQSTIRTNSSRMEPSTPTFALPSNSQDKVRRRGIQSSISTVSDRALV